VTEVSESGRIIARAAAVAFGGQARVDAFYDESEAHSVDMVTCTGSPTPDFASYSTVTLHETPNLLDGADVRVEMTGVADASVSAFPNMLATAAFAVVKDRWLCAPGVVFPGLVRDYGLSSELEHILWVPPFPWPTLTSQDAGGGLMVHWLLAVPISESERQLLDERGYDVLEAMFAEQEIEYFDLSRTPVA
jgi:hypothetical protein